MSARRPETVTATELYAMMREDAQIADETRPLRAALKKAEHYTDLRGRRHPLAAMSASEALLVLALLERHAETLHRGELAERLLNAAAATSDTERRDAIDAGRQAASISAATWLRQTPLYRALAERASR